MTMKTKRLALPCHLQRQHGKEQSTGHQKCRTRWKPAHQPAVNISVTGEEHIAASEKKGCYVDITDIHDPVAVDNCSQDESMNL